MIRLIFVGKTKDKDLESLINEYRKRLTKFCKLEIVELEDDKIAKDKETVIRREGERISKTFEDKPNNFVIALDLRGKQKSSEEFSDLIKSKEMEGDITFIIGGALGLSDSVIEKADLVLSFSKMTLSHRMIRVFLIEQIYRAYTILHGIDYHK